jgi:lipopolysaccharide transport system permease protein
VLSEDKKEKVIIKPTSGWVLINFREIWIYRDLLYFLVWREIKVRYKQTVLGAAWAIIQPFFMMVVFTLFFGKLAKIPSQGIPYPLFSYAALLPWMLFAEGINRSVNNMVHDTSLIKKVYFPRLIMPLAGAISPLIDFMISFVIFVGMMFYFGYIPTLRIIWLPAFLGLAMITSLAAGTWLSAINVKYRDVRYAVPFIIQFWLFVSPVVYPSSLLPRAWRLIYSLNPMAGVIEGFRWVLLGTNPPKSLMAISVFVVLLILVSGVFYFRRMEKTFADVL